MEDKNGTSVADAIVKIRELLRPHGIINTRLIENSLERRGQFCACLDVVEDCDWAIHRYQQGPPTEDLGFLYLMTYGLLQALCVQQDAVKYAAEAVRMPYSRPAALTDIRQVRNSAIGHAPENSNGIVQVELTYDRFTLYSFDPSTQREWQEVRFSELITRQLPHIVAGLNAIAQHLDATYGA